MAEAEGLCSKLSIEKLGRTVGILVFAPLEQLELLFPEDIKRAAVIMHHVYGCGICSKLYLSLTSPSEGKLFTEEGSKTVELNVTKLLNSYPLEKLKQPGQNYSS